jgi:hypothetical protein
VLLFQGNSKTVDDGSQYFQELCDAIMTFSLIYELEEYIIYRTANESSEVEKFAINAMEGSLEKITFSGVLRVEEFEKVEDKGLIDIASRQVSVEFCAFYETEEEFIDNLQMWPCKF